MDRDGGASPGRQDEQEALDALARAGASMIQGLAAALPGWAQQRVAVLLNAWGSHTADERRVIEDRARRAGARAAERVSAALTQLFAADPDEHALTPLQVVRTAHREVTEVLRSAGVPPVVRDAFDERAEPDDDYDLVPRSLADFGDEALASSHLRWGAAKARIHKIRRG